MSIHAINIKNKLSDDIIEKFMSLVSKEKYNKINKLIRNEDIQRTLMADIMIRFIIIKKFKINNNEISFIFNKYGKPFLNCINNFYFNISHSEEWIVCATDSQEVGVDIELIQPIDFEIARSFFSNEEYSWLMKKKESERLNYFYDLWTLKESYLKTIGIGLSEPLDSFSIIKDNGSIFIITNNNNSKIYFEQYNIDVRYKLSVCYMNNQYINSIEFIKLNDILELFI